MTSRLKNGRIMQRIAVHLSWPAIGGVGPEADVVKVRRYNDVCG